MLRSAFSKPLLWLSLQEEPQPHEHVERDAVKVSSGSGRWWAAQR